MLTEHQLWYWLCNIEGIGYKKITELLSSFENLWEIFNASEEKLNKIQCLDQKDKEYLLSKHDEERIKRCYESMLDSGITFLTQSEQQYPKKLLQLYDPPYGIYLKGKLMPESIPAISIVGARECSGYGKDMAQWFSYELAKAGVRIISGLAKGVDGHSHDGAMRADGYTLGILGCGIQICYPSTNYCLYERMQKQGGIISEYSCHTKPYAGNFPRRNRLIAALCDAVLVVEAREKSGSLITVDQALELGKTVFVVPGRLSDDLSKGCNQLIRMGAEIVTSPNDILEALHMNVIKATKQKPEKSIDALSNQERKVYELLSTTPLPLETLYLKSNIELSELTEILLVLEMKGVIQQKSKNCYCV